MIELNGYPWPALLSHIMMLSGAKWNLLQLMRRAIACVLEINDNSEQWRRYRVFEWKFAKPIKEAHHNKVVWSRWEVHDVGDGKTPIDEKYFQECFLNLKLLTKVDTHQPRNSSANDA